MFSFAGKKKEIHVYAPVRGSVKGIEEVQDAVFSEKMMGDGIAIEYEGGDVYAPVSGEIISTIEPSCHAFGMKTKEGLEVLVHVGLETLHLKQGVFQFVKHKGDYVQAGEKVIQVDEEQLKKQAFDVITPIVITNSDCFAIVDRSFNASHATSKETILLHCVKK